MILIFGCSLGADGSWSTFEISVGNPPQSVFVLPSTLVPSTWVVLNEGCTIDNPTNCRDLRGNLFDIHESTTREEVNTLTLGVETQLGWSDQDSADFGYDSVNLDTSDGALPIDRTVVGAVKTNDVYVGVLGIAARNYTLDNDTATSLLSNLRNAGQIPSLSYSYTAGQYYTGRFGGTKFLRKDTKANVGTGLQASLTLGGFDQSRFEPNDVNFDFGPDEINYLAAGLQSISFTGADGKSSTLLSDAVPVYIDSTISAMWLPNNTCNAIAQAFGLEFDSLHQMYTINDTQHAANMKNNPQLSLQLGNNVANGPSVSINMPYAALTMNFTNPNVPEAEVLSIFPLRPATSANQYTLGRAFLQEAVLTVDFERKNFSIAQAIPVTSTTQPQIINIVSLSDEGLHGGGSTAPSPSNPTSTAVTVVSTSSSSFPTGAIAGIVIAVIAVIASALAFLCFRRRRRGNKAKKHGNVEMGPAQLPPELAVADEKRAGGDYFSIAPKTAPPYSTTVHEAEIVNELDSPRLGTMVDPSQQPAITTVPRDSIKYHELPGKDPASELHSRSVSITSADAAPLGFNRMNTAASSAKNSPLVELSPNLDRLSSPTAASNAEGAWHGSHIEPSSPASAMSVPMTPAGRAHIVSHSKPSRGPNHGSPQGSIDNLGMSATISSFVTAGLGLSPQDEIQRKTSQRSSQSTLVGGLSGRASPEVGGNQTMSASAFNSPTMMPLQRPPAYGQVPGATTVFPEGQSEVQTPSDMEEGSRR